MEVHPCQYLIAEQLALPAAPAEALSTIALVLPVMETCLLHRLGRGVERLETPTSTADGLAMILPQGLPTLRAGGFCLQARLELPARAPSPDVAITLIATRFGSKQDDEQTVHR
jgi:hypothetical protein